MPHVDLIPVWEPVRVILVSIAVSVLIGVPVATLVAGLMGGAPLLVFGTEVVGLSVLAWAFMFGSPVAVLYGAMTALLLLAGLKSKRWHPGWYGWLVAGAAAGVVVAGLPTGLVLVQMTAGNRHGAGMVEVLGVFTATGLLCGAVLGLYGWHERRSGLWRRPFGS